MDRSKRIFTLSFIVLLGFSFSLFYHYFQGFYANKPYPHNTFLFHPRYAFTDFVDVINESANLNPYLGEKSGQFPFMIIIGKLFTVLSDFTSYILYLLICIVAFAYFAQKYLRIGPWYSQATAILTICFLSYPFLFTIDRGNFEFLLFIFLLSFLFLFEKKKYFWSAFPLALAIAMKVYPAIFLVLYIPERKWKEFFVTIGITITLSLGSMCLFQGGFLQNANYLLHLSNFSNNSLFLEFTSIESGSIIQRGVSILSLIKIFLGNNEVVPSEFWLNNFNKIYMIIASAGGIVIILYTIIRRNVFWKRVSILVFLMLLLPPLSGDYKLIHVFLPIFLFCNHTKMSKLDDIYILLFALLLIPKDYYILPKLLSDTAINRVSFHDISISMPINIVVLILFTTILIFSSRNEISGNTKDIPI